MDGNLWVYTAVGIRQEMSLTEGDEKNSRGSGKMTGGV